jgi:glycosyltransferase involved in cell wall biosynthesis
LRARRVVPQEPSAAPANATAPSATTPVAPAGRPGVLNRAYAALLDFAMHGRWARDAGAVASRLASQHQYDAVVSCGPPHMVHVAANAVATRHRLPLIIDLRDPWRLVERLADVIDSPVWRWQATWHERRVAPRANLIVMNTEPARDAMRALYPAMASRIITVMNGFDEETPPKTQRGHRFTVMYTGSIYLDRDPRPLFEAARRLIERRGLSPSDFGITFVGAVQEGKGGPTMSIARELGIEGHVELLPHRPRSELLGLLASSAMLLSLPQDSHMAIPSKVFEYMQFDAWILALAESKSAVARLLAASPADVVPPDAVERITEVLETRYAQYRAADYPVRLSVDARFSRRGQARILFDAIAGCTAQPLATP